MIRRLNPKEDEHLLRLAYEWDRHLPRWYQDLERVAGWPLEQFLKEAPDRADLGVFDEDEFVALVSIIRRDVGIFEGHIWAKRGSRVENLASAVTWVVERLIEDLQMKFGYVWVAKKKPPYQENVYNGGVRV